MDQMEKQFVVRHAKGQRGCENPTAKQVIQHIAELAEKIPKHKVRALIVSCIGDKELRNCDDGVRRIYIVDGQVPIDIGWDVRSPESRDGHIYEADPQAEVVVVSSAIKTHHDLMASMIFYHFLSMEKGQKPVRHPFGYGHGRTALPNVGTPLINQKKKLPYRNVRSEQVGRRF